MVFVTFGELQRRFVALLKNRVRSGELSERRLARLIGISQPHLHNVLQGKRAFSTETADDILRHLDVTVLELIEPEEWKNRRAN